MFISKLGPKQRGRESAGWREPLSRQKLCENLVAKNGGKRERGRGESQEKVQVTLFFFLESNSGWTQGDARQFTKSQALLSHFSMPCNLERGPNLLQLPMHRLHSLTFINLVKIPECQLVPSTSFWGNLVQILTQKNKMPVKNID